VLAQRLAQLRYKVITGVNECWRDIEPQLMMKKLNKYH